MFESENTIFIQAFGLKKHNKFCFQALAKVSVINHYLFSSRWSKSLMTFDVRRRACLTDWKPSKPVSLSCVCAQSEPTGWGRVEPMAVCSCVDWDVVWASEPSRCEPGWWDRDRAGHMADCLGCCMLGQSVDDGSRDRWLGGDRMCTVRASSPALLRGRSPVRRIPGPGFLVVGSSLCLPSLLATGGLNIVWSTMSESACQGSYIYERLVNKWFNNN